MKEKLKAFLINNNFKWLLLVISVLVFLALSALSYSEYTTSMNKTISLNIRKPVYTIDFYPGTKTEGNKVSQTFTYGTAQNLRTNAFTKTSYSFTGWNTQEDGMGTNYTDEQEVLNLTQIDGTVIDLFAQWQSEDFSVTYNFGDEGFNGTEYLNTGILLFNTDNFHKDFEIAFNIDRFEYLSGQNNNRNSIVCSQLEGISPFPGFGLVYRESAMKVAANATSSGQYNTAIGRNTGEILFKRITDVLYFGDENVIDFSTITEANRTKMNNNNVYLTFGANLNENGVYRRYSNVDLSNITIKLKYQASEFIDLYSKLPIPTRTGYDFDGWYTEPNGGGTKINSSTVFEPSVMTLYAKWVPYTYTVKFSKNGGSGTMDNQTFTYGESQILNKTTYTNTSYGVKSWNTKADGTGKSYPIKQLVKNLTSVKNGTVTLYAQWTSRTLITQAIKPEDQDVKFLKGPIFKTQIEKVEFVASIEGANDTKWDVSTVGDDSILAWYTDIDNDGYYEVKIGSVDGTVKANPNSTYLFEYIGYNGDDTTCIGGIQYLDTTGVTNMTRMFFNCGYSSMTSLDLGNSFDTSSVKDMSQMFNNCGRNAMTRLNLGSSFNTSNVEYMQSMFNGCGYSEMTSLDLGESFNTIKVKSMKSMFSYCGETKMTSLNLRSNFNTSNVENMQAMFAGCGRRKLQSLDLGNQFYTTKITNMSEMFKQCGQDSMTSINLGDNFDTSNVISMRQMFEGCGRHGLVKLDLGNNFDTSKVTNMYRMFYAVGTETLNELKLGNKFDTSKVENMKEMFSICASYNGSSLTTLDLRYLTFDTNILTEYTDIFKDCGKNTTVIINEEYESFVRANASTRWSNIVTVTVITPTT